MRKIFVFFILMIVPVILLAPFRAVHTSANRLAVLAPQDADVPWYNPAWHYRASVTINNSSAVILAYYQVLVKLDATNFNFGQANADGSDLRVTDSDGVTPLAFWIESWSAPLAYVWIRVPTIPATPGTATVFLYFGNSAAAAASRGDLTFEFFDDAWCQFPGSTGCGPSNPVLSAGQSWWENSAGFPEVFEDPSFLPSRPRYHMLYSGYNVIGPAKGYATSSDLNTWTEYDAGPPHPTNPNPVIGVGYGGNVSLTYGDTIKVGSTYYIFAFRNNSTAQRAESTDLLNWTNFINLSISTGPINSAIGILKEGDGITPIVVNGEYWMVYARDAGTGGLYLAHSSDLINWIDYSLAIISPTTGGWDASGLWTPSFTRLGDKYYIYYQGNGAGGWEIGFAKADAYSSGSPVVPPNSPSSWTKSASSVIKRGSSGSWDNAMAVHPMIRRFSNGIYYVFYAGYSTVYKIGYAYASSPEGPWNKLAGSNSQWTGNSPTVSGGILPLNTGQSITSRVTFQYRAVGYRANFAVASNLLWAGFINSGSSGDRTMIGSNASETTRLYLKDYVSNSGNTLLCDGCRGAFHVYEVLWKSGQSLARMDHGTSVSESAQVPASTLPVTFNNYNTSGTNLSIDWVYVRQYNNPEPTTIVNAATTCMPTTVDVDDNFAPGALDGSHIWNCNAFNSIQTALDTATTATTINVADGTYVESVTLNRAATVSMSGNATINGSLSIQSGAFNASVGSLTITGNFTLSGGVFSHGSGTLAFTGAGTHNLSLSSATIFNNLTVDTSAILIETASADNATIVGTMTNSGTIHKSQTVTATGLLTFGLTGVTIEVTDRTGGDPLTNLVVDRIDQNHPNGTGCNGCGTNTGRYWTITPTGSNYTVNLTLPHNLAHPDYASVCRYDGPGAPGAHWNCDASSYTANTVTRNGISQLSDWAVGYSAGPTVINLQGISAHSRGGPVISGWLTICLLVGAFVFVIAFWYFRMKRRVLG